MVGLSLVTEGSLSTLSCTTLALAPMINPVSAPTILLAPIGRYASALIAYSLSAPIVCSVSPPVVYSCVYQPLSYSVSASIEHVHISALILILVSTPIGRYPCISPYLDSCFSPYLDSCISPYRILCIRTYFESCISPYRTLCIRPYLESCISPYRTISDSVEHHVSAPIERYV